MFLRALLRLAGADLVQTASGRIECLERESTHHLRRWIGPKRVLGGRSMIRALGILQSQERGAVFALPVGPPTRRRAHSLPNRCGLVVSNAESPRSSSNASATIVAVNGASSTPLR